MFRNFEQEARIVSLRFASRKHVFLLCKYACPIPILHQVHCSVLAILGGMDPLVPAQKSAEIWKTAIAEAGNRDATIRILPYADHSLVDPAFGTQHP
jgi:dienelactone hydrolase